MALTPQAQERISREAANVPFDVAARGINADWGTHYDGTQIQRWAEHDGGKLVALQEAERKAFKKGRRPEGPANAPELLVAGFDGGRVQEKDKDPDTQSRWKEDKVLTIRSYRKAPPEEPGGDPEPVRLLTTYVGTMQEAKHFGQLARIEAERRGIRQAVEVVCLGDAAGWVDTTASEQFTCHARIVDYYHVVEHLASCAKALYPGAEAAKKRLAERLAGQLYNGKAALIIRWLERQVRQHGPPRAQDPAEHPRRVLAETLTYMQRHQQHMDYPRYRKNGWPIGSGVTESGVKLFNKRVKGTEQFWADEGVNAILALRALWLSEDERWQHYRLYGRLLRSAA